MSACVYVCMVMCMCVCTCERVYVCLFASVCVSGCVCKYVCVCVFAFERVCVKPIEPNLASAYAEDPCACIIRCLVSTRRAYTHLYIYPPAPCGPSACEGFECRFISL